MALVLDATVGGPNSNSYSTLTEANEYHEAHLYATDWTGATDPKKEAALVWATRLLDELVDWYGYRSEEPDVQALRWPRTGVMGRDGYYFDEDIIPQFLKDATAEFARNLLASNRLAEEETGLKSLGVGSINLSFDKEDRKNVIPPSVLSLVRPFGLLENDPKNRGDRTVTLVRT